MKRATLSMVTVIASVISAWGWGSDGHRAIAVVAFNHLNSRASNAVISILSSGQIPEIVTLADAATWPDDIKDGRPPHAGKYHNTPAAKDFKTRFPQHERWHYVNYPLGASYYSLSGAFSRSNDIVHQIRACIDTLEKPPGGPLSKSEALCFLIHLVGDLHQPLHVACGYYALDPQNIAHLVKTPKAPHDALHDRGGNGLKWTNGGSTNKNLHSFWDNDLVSANGSTEIILANHLEENWRNLNLRPDRGKIRSWPANWARHSISKARDIYVDASGAIGIPGTDRDDPGQGTVEIQISITGADYKLEHKAEAKDELTRAAFHLAALLNAINWR